MTYFPRLKLFIICTSILSLTTLQGCTQTNKAANKSNNPTNLSEKIAKDSNPTNLHQNNLQNNPSEDSLISKRLYQNKLTRWLHPYKIDVQQGNVITAEMLEKLHIGMTKPQVKLLLGTSVLSGSPAKNQWLYVYNNAESGMVKTEQNLILTFNQDELLSDIKEEKRVN